MMTNADLIERIQFARTREEAMTYVDQFCQERQLIGAERHPFEHLAEGKPPVSNYKTSEVTNLTSRTVQTTIVSR